MQPTFEQYIEGFGALLECPSCGGNHLRHEKIDVFEREEDRDDGIHILVTDGAATVDTSEPLAKGCLRAGFSALEWKNGRCGRPFLA